VLVCGARHDDGTGVGVWVNDGEADPDGSDLMSSYGLRPDADRR
jgi:hypothetical protein